MKEDTNDDKDSDDDKKPSAPQILEKTVKEPELPVQKTPLPSILSESPVVVQPKAAAPAQSLSTSTSHISPSDIVHATLEKMKKQKESEKE